MKHLFPRLLLICPMLLAGCGGYRLGPTGGQIAGDRSLQIAPFVNATQEARMLDPLTTALRRRVQEDGTFKLATREDGDIVLSGTITEYHRKELSYSPTDIVTVRDYQLIMTVHAVARDRTTNKLLLDRNVSGKTTIRVGTDLTSAERQAMPLVADDLARNLVGLLADGDW